MINDNLKKTRVIIGMIDLSNERVVKGVKEYEKTKKTKETKKK